MRAASLPGGIPHRFDLGVLVETGHTVLPAHTAVLVSTERRVGAVRRAAVDAHEAGLDPAGHRQRVLQGAGHDVAGQAVHAVVGDPDRVFLVVERDDAQHRPEDLLLSNGHGVVDIGEKRWPYVISLVETGGRTGAADQRRRTLVHALLDVARHPLELPFGDQWAAQRSGILRVATRYVFVDALEDRHTFFVAGPRQQHPGRVGTTLAGVHARRYADRARQPEVGIFEDDGGGLAAELQEQPLHGGRTLFHDPLADHRRAGERDQVDLG